MGMGNLLAVGQIRPGRARSGSEGYEDIKFWVRQPEGPAEGAVEPMARRKWKVG